MRCNNGWSKLAYELADNLYIENNIPKGKESTLLMYEAKLCLTEINVDVLCGLLNGSYTTEKATEILGTDKKGFTDRLWRIKQSMMNERVRIILQNGATPEELGYQPDWKIEALPIPSIAVTKLHKRKIHNIKDFAKLTCIDLDKRFGMKGAYVKSVEKCIRSKEMNTFRKRVSEA